MLHHFRKYQQYIFLVITAVIILSFSFFGTSGVMNFRTVQDDPAFKTADGKTVYQSEVNQMTLFIATDETDALRYQGAPGLNFLNDGVIANDFLKTGLAYILLENFQDPLKADLDSRSAKEKHYTLYAHKQAPFISVENVWSFFAKDMGSSYRALKNSSNPLSKTSFDARVNLYLKERAFPASFLNQFLRYQQTQYDWVKPDQNLEFMDLSLFNYHTFEDWFGPRLLKLSAEVIINASDSAKKAGYFVSKEEALADLKKNTLESYKKLQKNSRLTAKNPDEYFQDQLKRLGMDQNQAIKLWQKVLLFRRYMQEVSHSVFVSSLPFKAMNDHAKEGVQGEIYVLSDSLRFNSPKDFELFEIYLDSILKPESKDALVLADLQIKNPLEVAKKTGGLVEVRYPIELLEVDSLNLLGKATLRDIWKWEVEASNWSLLVQEFPELGLKLASTSEERQSALDSLTSETRSRIDYFARKEIAKAKPEWIEEAFAKAEPSSITLNVNMKGQSEQLRTVEEIKLQEALEKLKNKEVKEATLNSKDGKKWYRLTLGGQIENPRILTFKEAKEKGILEPLLSDILENHYEKMQTSPSFAFKTADGEIKKLVEMESEVSSDYFKEILAKVHNEAVKGPLKDTGGKKDLKTLYPYRFYAHMEKSLKKLKENEPLPLYPENETEAIEDQWKLVKTPFTRDKRSFGAPSLEDLKKVSLLTFSDVLFDPNHGLYFFFANEKVQPNQLDAISEALSIQELLGNEALKNFFQIYITELKEKNALDPVFVEPLET